MKTPIRVLVVEDSEDDTVLLVRELQRNGYEPTYERVETRDAMAVALANRPWDIIVADYHMPRFTAPDALSLLKEKGLDLPFVILSGSIQEETAVAAMKAGADDYVMKNNLGRLVPAIERELGESAVRQARRRAEASLDDRVRQQAAVAVLGQRALRNNDVAMLLDHAVTLVAETLEVDYCEFLELLPGHNGLLLCAGSGWKKGNVGITVVDVGIGSQAGYTLLHKEPVIVDDLHKEGRFPATSLLREHNVVSGMSVVVHGRDRALGVLGAHAAKRRIFTKDDVHFLQAVANLIAAAIERKLLEEHTFQAQKLEAIEQLAGGIAHHFNNLMAAVVGFSDLMLMRIGADDPLHRYAEQIKSAADRASALTRQLLDFSRNRPRAPRDINLNGVVKAMEKMLRSLLGDHIDLSLLCVPDLHQVKADPVQIEQLIVNLSANSREAMPEGGTLKITTANITLAHKVAAAGGEVPPGDYVLLAVSDSGVGMSDEVKAHMFEPFFTTKEAANSTGMGLATCYGIVKQSDGYIDCESRQGKGTTFKIYFPRVTAT
jgi:signal transduction histidine kinase/DNA-binding response OmpR family regulator